MDQELLFCGFSTKTGQNSAIDLDIPTFSWVTGCSTAKAWKGLWSSNPTFPALPNVTTHTVWTPDQFLCQPGAEEAHRHHFGLFFYLSGSPLIVVFFPASPYEWWDIQRVVLREKKWSRGIQLTYFLSCHYWIISLSALISPGADRLISPWTGPISLSKVPRCTWTSFPREFQIQIAKGPRSFGANRDNFSTHRCKYRKCQCLLPHTSLAFQGVSVAMGTLGTFVRIPHPWKFAVSLKHNSLAHLFYSLSLLSINYEQKTFSTALWWFRNPNSTFSCTLILSWLLLRL